VVFSIALDVLIGVYILSRQRRIRPVPRVLSLRFPIIVGIIGLIDLLSYTDTHHHITQTAYLWVLATIVVGALLLGAVRALTVKIWTSNNWVVRQGTWLTIGLWVLSLALHFAGGIGAQHSGAGNLEASSFLLYLALTYGVQNYVVFRRATPLWDALGPEAGRRLQVNFGAGPDGSGAFFTMFGGGGGDPDGAAPGFGRRPDQGTVRTYENDPTIIDAEVVEDDEGPPELH
jgi:hypothetical protein